MKNVLLILGEQNSGKSTMLIHLQEQQGVIPFDEINTLEEIVSIMLKEELKDKSVAIASQLRYGDIPKWVLKGFNSVYVMGKGYVYHGNPNML